MACKATRFAALMVTAGIVLASTPAWAQDERADAWRAPGAYLGVAGLVVFAQDAPLENPDLPSLAFEFTTDVGLGISGFAGYRFGNGFRAEAELAFRHNALDEATFDDPTGIVFGVPSSGSGPIEGDFSSLAAMLNAYYDFETGSPVIPYLGEGVGFASVGLKIDDAGIDESDSVFAYQGRAGLSLAVSPTAVLFAGYTYFATADPKFGQAESEYRTHNVEVGVRVGF